VFNAMIDRRPLVIVRCRSADDVVRGLALARERELVVSVRGGGHNVAGNAVCDGGVMLDLSPMRAVRVDPAARTAIADPGCLLGDLDRATQAHGLATPTGVMSGTGLAGLTLGGGLGWLNGRCGLACDNLVAAEVVTAGGDVRQVDAAESHPDVAPDAQHPQRLSDRHRPGQRPAAGPDLPSGRVHRGRERDGQRECAVLERLLRRR